MRSVLCSLLIAAPAFASHLDGPRLERLLGLGQGPGDALPVETAAPSPLPWRLLGTLRSREGRSFAAVECVTKSVTLQVGDVRDGIEVVEIEQQTLIVRRLGRLERIGSKPGEGRAAPSPARSLSRQVVDRLLTNPQELLRQAQLFPAMVGGKLTGFRAQWVKEGSVAAGLGLQAGDLITRVNGVSLDSLDRAIGLLSLLGTTRRFEVELERSGQRVKEVVELDR